MSIEKLDFQRVTKDHLPFTTFLNKVIQNIRNAEALALWVFLSSLPPRWEINKTHIQNHFGFGEKKIKFLFSYLNKSNLLEYHQPRNVDGKWTESSIHILSGENFASIDLQEPAGAEIAENDHLAGGAEIAPPVSNVGRTTGGSKTVRTVNGSYRKDGHINTTLLIKKRGNERIFPNYEKPKPSGQNYTNKTEIKCTVMEYGPGHPHWEKMQLIKKGIIYGEKTG